MIKNIKVVPNAGRDEITEDGDLLIVKVRAPAKDNKANMAVIRLLSKYLGKNIKMVSGFKGKRKVVEIEE